MPHPFLGGGWSVAHLHSNKNPLITKSTKDQADLSPIPMLEFQQKDWKFRSAAFLILLLQEIQSSFLIDDPIIF